MPKWVWFCLAIGASAAYHGFILVTMRRARLTGLREPPSIKLHVFQGSTHGTGTTKDASFTVALSNEGPGFGTGWKVTFRGPRLGPQAALRSVDGAVLWHAIGQVEIWREPTTRTVLRIAQLVEGEETIVDYTIDADRMEHLSGRIHLTVTGEEQDIWLD